MHVIPSTTTTSIYMALHSAIKSEKKRLEEAWKLSRLAAKLEVEEIEELEDISIPTKL